MTFQKGYIPWNKGKKMSEDFCRKISEVQKNMPIELLGSRGLKGSKHPSWKGGKSKEIYPVEFTRKLKEEIRILNNNTCQFCGKTQEEEIKNIERKLSIHHIDYDKQNCAENNLTCLCATCSSKVNRNREEWTIYFNRK